MKKILKITSGWILLIFGVIVLVTALKQMFPTFYALVDALTSEVSSERRAEIVGRLLGGILITILAFLLIKKGAALKS
ncbi:hypothetical protein J2I47_14990 [Fibrella sp. HMF5335]|uniref:Uncharacterized protein n=1 Tax=Fibrella rubiginis TaxID=2817060 RepID=A0A939GJZ7_9BACT|nr:hypothetical protein [Fibrella rubiginis]MBO0937862.1 hypothetical protein [Fibrella rubiginis]